MVRRVEDSLKMLISEIDGVEFAPEYPELAGKRILMTGLRGGLGHELARFFAEARTQLILQLDGDGPEAVALGESVARCAMDVSLFTDPFGDHDAIVKFARQAVQRYGGVDAVINVVHAGEIACGATAGDIEKSVADLLARPCLVTRVVANRMRATLTEGSILNVVAVDPTASPKARTIARLAQAALAAFTRSEAQEVSVAGIRINAVAPAEQHRSNRCLSGTADVATVALHLAAGRGHKLSGLVFEAYFG